MNTLKKSILPVATALALVACTDTPDLDDAEAELTATYKASIKSRTLSIVGNNADSRLSLRLGATPDRLVVDVGDDGTADFTFDRAKLDRIAVDAAGGNDVITMDERFGAFTTEEQVAVNGGSGNDTITGGFGAESLAGGAGNDTIHGRGGSDSISLGAGDDTVLWQPGDSSDIVEGGDGFDALLFAMANIGEDIDLSAVGDRLRLTRNVATIAMDLHALERVELHAQGGTDRVFIHDLAPAFVDEVDVDLLSTGTGGGDALPDEVWLDTTTGADAIDVASDAGTVVVTGLATEVRIRNGEPALDRLYVSSDGSDRVTISGSAGPDVMTAYGDASALQFDGGGFDVLVTPGLATPVTISGGGGDDAITIASSVTASIAVDGGDGNDRLVGGSGPDVLRGGAGNDVVDGRFGADRAELGDGDDTFVWNPGNASDVVDGGAGIDALLFASSAASESIDVRASGSRVRLFRDIATVTLDLGGIENLDVRPRGGTDTIAIGTLTGTEVANIDVDLAPTEGTLGGDAQADVIALTSSGGLVVTADGAAVAATGFGARLRVTNGDPSLDRMTIAASTLAIEGTPAADTMVATGDSNGNVVYDGGGYNLLVAPSTSTSVTVRGNGGDDWLGSGGSVAASLVLDGGDGNDTLNGGAGADRLLGGPGADVVNGRLGADVVLLGDGDDTFAWNPGDGNDIVDGESGGDVLVLSGANIGEAFDLAANASRVRLTRSVGSVVLDLGGLEQIELRARGGADVINVGDLSGTSIGQLSIELADALQASDGLIDAITLNGTNADDHIDIVSDGAAVLVSGLAASVRIGGADPADQLAVHGGAGNDAFAIAPGVFSLMSVTAFAD